MRYEELMQRYFREAGVSLQPGISRKLSLYMEELFRWNEKINLTAITEPEEAVVKLFVDATYPSSLIETGDAVLDIGSGAGFPGMVLALLCPGASVTLAEARFRKTAFLKRIKGLTGAKNVFFFEGALRKEDARSLGPFTRITSRATARVERIAALGKHFLDDKGILIIMGGRGEGRSFGDVVFERAIPYTLPGGFGSRKMCLYKKR